MYVPGWGGEIPSGRGFILAPSSQLFCRGRPEAFSMHEAPGLFPQPCSLDFGGLGEAAGELCRGNTGARSPGSKLSSSPQLACGVIWLSGYGPIWSQNATDLLSSLFTLPEQLGPMVSKLQELPGRRERPGTSSVTKPWMGLL